MVETGEDYSEVKCALLRSVGETVATYGNKLFSLSTDTFKAMTADQFIELVLGGLFQKVKTVDEGIFVLARAIARYYLLNGGRLFLESRQINTKEELREGLDDWLSTRSRGNYFKPFGSSEGPKTERYEWNDRFPRDGARGDSRPTCFNCSKVGHKAVDCSYRGSDSHRGGAGSPNVDTVTGPTGIWVLFP